jgi:hypothetical protein
MQLKPPFPAELLQRDQWCLWRVEKDKEGRSTKIPYRPDGGKAATNKPATWSAFKTVWNIQEQQPENYQGVGFIFTANDPFCGIDLDASLDIGGKLRSWATTIVERFKNTYQSLSVSGYGLHIVCRGKLPSNGKNRYIPDAPTGPDGKRAQVGIFDRGRFFALTGNLYGSSPLQLVGYQESIDWLLGLVESLRRGQQQNSAKGLSDAEILERARRAKNGGKFAELWLGKWKVHYGSQSEADLALCCMLAFWCGPNPTRIDSLFRQSELVRGKWLEREDYRERTIQAALAQSKEYFQPQREAQPRVIPFPGTRKDQKAIPEVWVGARQLPAITAQALAALQAANMKPELFVRAGRMVTLVGDERDRHIIAEVSEDSLRGRLARSGFYYKLTKGGDRIECAPPMDIVRDILALPPKEWKFPALEALIETPFLGPNGTVRTTPGYDPATYLYYAPARSLRLLDVPEFPIIDDVKAALDLIESAIHDFPFVDQASKANAIASIITPTVRPAIDGPTPLAIFDAPQAGTGKTLLAELVAIIATGRAAENFTAPVDPEEWRKKITTILSSGTGVVVIDNVNSPLNSDALCSAITSIAMSDRIFRTFDRIVLPVKCTWIATGNNVQLGGDMPRRCYWIRLDAQRSKPFLRTGFMHENLRAWVTEKRGALIAGLLTLARYWFLQGRPAPQKVLTLGSFESWCNVIGGILELARVENFLGNAELKLEQADVEGLQWEAFLLALSDVFGTAPFRVTEVVEKVAVKDLVSPDAKRIRQCIPDFVAEAADRNGGFFQKRLGRCFAARAGRRFGESQVFIDRGGEDLKVKVHLWKVVRP